MKLDQLFWKRAGIVAPLGLLAATWVMTRVGSVLPKILSDELIYSLDARRLAPSESAIPNYLFNFVFSSTNLCGYGFYGCAKGLNLVFLLGLGVVIYLTARLFAKPGLSLFVALLTVVGPISSYVSYFTPDLMFFFSASLVIYFLLKQTRQSPLVSWLLVGLGIGVSALVKPHALFLLLPVVIYIFYLGLKGAKAAWLASAAKAAIVIVSTFSLKWLVGFMIAGAKGLGLFGSSYDASASAVGAGAGGTPTLSNHFAAWLGQSSLQITFHIAFLLIFFGGPLVAMFLKRDTSLRNPLTNESYEGLRFFVGISTLVLIGVSSIFVVISASWGEALENRVMVRYYEYILVFVPLLLLPLLNEVRIVGTNLKWLAPVVAVAVWAVALPIMTNVVPPLFTDSSLIASVLKSGLTLFTFAAISLAAIIYLLANPTKGAQLWLFGVAPLYVLVFAISSYVNMTVPSSVVGMYTHSSRWVHDNLTDGQKRGMVVYGNVLQNVSAARLWIDEPTTTGQALQPGSQVDLNALANGTYALLIGELVPVGSGVVVHEEASFKVIQVQH